MSNSLWPRLYPTRLPSPWNSPGKNTGVGSHSLLQRIFPTQGLNPVLPHCRQILQHLSHQGSPSNLIGHPIFLFAKPDHPGQTPTVCCPTHKPAFGRSQCRFLCLPFHLQAGQTTRSSWAACSCSQSCCPWQGVTAAGLGEWGLMALQAGFTQQESSGVQWIITGSVTKHIRLLRPIEKEVPPALTGYSKNKQWHTPTHHYHSRVLRWRRKLPLSLTPEMGKHKHSCCLRTQRMPRRRWYKPQARTGWSLPCSAQLVVRTRHTTGGCLSAPHLQKHQILDDSLFRKQACWKSNFCNNLCINFSL